MVGRYMLAMAAALWSVGARGQPIRIGLTGPFDGPAGGVGYALRDGVKLAAAEINQAGGIMGRPIELVERDDAANPGRAARIAHDLIEGQHVVATVGFAETDVALAAEPLYQAAHIPVLNAVATGTAIARQFAPPAQDANYIFQMAASDAVQATLIPREAIAGRHFKAPAILTDATAYGRDARAIFEQTLDALDVKPAAEETFDPGDTDMTTQLSRAKRADADVILVFGRAAALIRIVNSMAVLGWKLPVIGGWPLSTAPFMVGAGINADGVAMPQTVIQAGNTPRRAAFDAAYARALKTQRIISVDCVAQAYDSLYLLKAAIEQAGSTDGPAIRDALAAAPRF